MLGGLWRRWWEGDGKVVGKWWQGGGKVVGDGDGWWKVIGRWWGVGLCGIPKTEPNYGFIQEPKNEPNS